MRDAKSLIGGKAWSSGDGIAVIPLTTPTLPPATTTNAFLVGRRDFLVVEPASPYEGEQERLWALVAKRLAGGGRCVGIAVTHHHPDHVGGLNPLLRRLSAPLMAHGKTAELIRPMRPVDRFLEDGDWIDLEGEACVRVFHTPGHARGHLCFYHPESGSMIVGDMLASVGTILITPEEGNMADYLASLARLKEVGATKLLPAHGTALLDPKSAVDGTISHRLAREAKVLQALMRHPHGRSLQSLLPEVYDDTPILYHKWAALSLESHLIKLVKDEKVVIHGESGYLLSAPGRS